MFVIKIKNIKTDEFEVKVRGTETVAQLKAKIEAHTEIPVSEQILLCKGIQLEDGETLSKYPIVEGTIIDLMKKLDN